MTIPPLLRRRAALGALAASPWLLTACSTPMPIGPLPAGDADAAARLRDSARAHGLEAYRRLGDINVGYAGQWRPLVNRLQPELVDAGFRGPSQERLMPRAGIVAQSYDGAKGRKQVVWTRGGRQGRGDDLGEVSVWLNGQRSNDPAVLDTAALVAEGYGLFLLGPLWLIDRAPRLRHAGTQTVDGRACDVIDAWISPGLGRARTDRLALSIDRSDGLLRRVRFTLEGFVNTQGAVAEVDCLDYQRWFGIAWPTRWHERLIHPLPLPVHDWHLTGLDVDRGYGVSDVSGDTFDGAAAAPARPPGGSDRPARPPLPTP